QWRVAPAWWPPERSIRQAAATLRGSDRTDGAPAAGPDDVGGSRWRDPASSRQRGATRVTAAAARPLHSPPADGGRMAHDPEHETRNRHSQFDLLRQRRFLPYFSVQALGAFND